MQASDNAKAILLLTAHLGRQKADGPKPLTPTEWRQMRMWMERLSLRPEDFLNEHADAARQSLGHGEWASRIKRLLERGMAVAAAVERWLGAGIWIESYLDAGYPSVLRSQIKHWFPPVVFGCGNQALLYSGGLAVVGSKQVPDAADRYAYRLGAAAAAESVSIVSGLTRAVYRGALLGALENGGCAVGVLPYDLLRRSKDRLWRDFIERGTLAIMSVTVPDYDLHRVPWVGAAMLRNDYFYCLSDCAIIVHSDTRGSTWEGALKNQREGWVPQWVRQPHIAATGNDALRAVGARPLPRGNNAPAHLRLVLSDIKPSPPGTEVAGDAAPNSGGIGCAAADPAYAQATVLLTTEMDVDDERPLNNREWGEFAQWLRGRGSSPADLMSNGIELLVPHWSKAPIKLDRVRRLLTAPRMERLVQLEKEWTDADLWHMTRGHKHYPKALKDLFRHDRPAMLYGCGLRSLLSDEPIGAAGSDTTANAECMRYAYEFGVEVAYQERVLISHGLSRIEQAALKGALEQGGRAVIVAPGGLLKTLKERSYWQYINSDRLALFSALPPQAKIVKKSSALFTYHANIVYGMAEAVAILAAGRTDAVARTAIKFLRRFSKPFWACRFSDDRMQPTSIIARGGQWLPEGDSAHKHLELMLDDLRSAPKDKDA